jgi:hypothetical protein
MFIYINPIQDLAIFHPWRYLIFFGGNAKNDKNGVNEKALMHDNCKLS